MIINAIVRRYKETNGIFGFFLLGVYQRSEPLFEVCPVRLVILGDE